ncbi:MAG: hypothetical protein IKC80_01255 [Kiritimatiellae bacterium]|nr:hypothetical protein [Kiritimatiellia bacterium]
MNAFDVLNSWPGIQDLSAEDIFAHPAWAMPCLWGDERCMLRRAEAKPRDVIGIALSLDDDNVFLGLGKRESFPDLHDLWARKADLPPALILALVEKECGELLQLIENTFRRQVRVTGLDDPGKRAGGVAFEVVAPTDGSVRASFVMDVRPSAIRMFGQLRFMDVDHASLRSMTRPVRALYALFDLSAEESAGLAPGDMIMLPELESGAGAWLDSPVGDGRFRVVSREERPISFAEFAAGETPPVPPPSGLELWRGGSVVARGRFGELCSRPAFVIEEVV